MTDIRRRTGLWLILALAFALVAVACGGGAEEPGAEPATTEAITETTEAITDTTGTTAAGTTETTAGAAGELGEVTVAEGQPIEIATIQTISGGTASLGQDQVTATEIAIEDRDSELLGHPIELQVEDGLCSADGGTTAAQKIVSDPQVIGIIGTSCSGAGVPASQIMSQAGLVMISGSNTSPSLTALPYLADDPLEAQENWQEGYFRTAHNDEFQGHGAAQFAFEQLGAQRAVTVHDGDPYTEGLTGQFGEFFRQFGGEIVLATAINKGDTDMRPLLTTAASAQPHIVFMPIFQPEADFIVQQRTEFPELQDVTFMGADGLLSDTFVTLPDTEGMYFSGPAVEQEGAAYDEFVAKYEEKAGQPPIQAFHAHAYDATNILLDAIEAVAEEQDGGLVIDRQALRDYIYDLEGFEGLTGTLSCNQFGDCAQPRIGVYLNEDPSGGITAVVLNAVFTSSPEVPEEKLQ
ncbi:MAG: branched-chain amino acid ABC transporter substrate-binding protein [Actinomycetota bacterium]|nr:branched-chain amino acid ABC transporter substrate-binding protein [Actinomycetota bacterium]